LFRQPAYNAYQLLIQEEEVALVEVTSLSLSSPEGPITSYCPLVGVLSPGFNFLSDIFIIPSENTFILVGEKKINLLSLLSEAGYRWLNLL